MKMVKIKVCGMRNCAYNKDKQCHAMAITVGGPDPLCDTFWRNVNKGGAADSNGSVGACRVMDCRFNQSLECAASGIEIGAHVRHADCLTFKPR